MAALQKLRLTTGGRNLDTRETAATLALHADRLRRYPRDVIDEVCAIDKFEWFPPLKLLTNAAERMTEPRRKILSRPQYVPVKQIAAEPKRRGPPTAEEIAEVERVMRWPQGLPLLNLDQLALYR